MKNWTETKLPPIPRKRNVIYENDELDTIFSQLGIRNLDPEYWEQFSTIKGRYERFYNITEGQARFVRNCWKRHLWKEGQKRGSREGSSRELSEFATHGQ